MTSVFLNLLTDVFNSYAKRIKFDEFCHWLLNNANSKQNSMIYQLLAVTKQNSKLTAQVDRAKERLRHRKSEKDSLQSAETTSAFTNMIDNRVEEFQSLIFAMSPIDQDVTRKNIYSDWLSYLHRQFIALTHLDYELTEDVKMIAIQKTSANTKVSDSEQIFIEVLELQENERAHFQSHDTDVLYAPVDQVRALVLFRIQNCLLSRAVTGTFVEHVPFQTDHSATISAVATGRYLASHCMNGLRNLHDAQNVSSDRPTAAQYSYIDLLQFLSSHNSQLDEVLTLPKSSFPLQYCKKTTDAFESETRTLIDEFTVYYDSLSTTEQQKFRNDASANDVEQKPVDFLSKKRLQRKKRPKNVTNKNNDNDDNDDDEKTVDDDDDDNDKNKRTKRVYFPSVSSTLTSTISTSSTVATTSSIIALSTPSIFDQDAHSLFSGDNSHSVAFRPFYGLNSLLPAPCISHETDVFRKTVSQMHSPRAVPFFAQPSHASLDEEYEKRCTNCVRLQSLLNDIQSKEREASTADLVTFLCQDAVASSIVMTSQIANGELELHHRDAQISNGELELYHRDTQERIEKLEAVHHTKLEVANKKIADLQEELALAKKKLAESQSLQIFTQNLRVLAERKAEKLERQQKQGVNRLPKVSNVCTVGDHFNLSFL